VPDTRSHRGPDPADERLFSEATLGDLRRATDDLCWLLSHGYAVRSAIELVGNRYSLAARQRLAVARCACSTEAMQGRALRNVGPTAVRGRELWLDGLNVLTGLEVALSGGVILLGRDGCCRDLAGVHGHYREVEETLPALKLVGGFVAESGVTKCHWFLDKPVSNSGRVKVAIEETGAELELDWEAELVYNPDAILSKTEEIVASSDSAILDRCRSWLNVVRHIIDRHLPQARLVDLAV
jgi:hypothetical protein